MKGSVTGQTSQKSVAILPRTVLNLQRMVIYHFSYPSNSTIIRRTGSERFVSKKEAVIA
jgi:hypothetical protein